MCVPSVCRCVATVWRTRDTLCCVLTCDDGGRWSVLVAGPRRDAASEAHSREDADARPYELHTAQEVSGGNEGVGSGAAVRSTVSLDPTHQQENAMFYLRAIRDV